MKGQVITEVPSELASAAVDGVVVSADGVYDYIQQQNQENLNTEFINNEKITAQALVNLDTRKSDKSELSNIENKIKNEILTNEEILSAAINFINNIKADKLDIYNEEEKRVLEDERLQGLINNLNNTLNSIIGTSDATSAIDTFNEIITFLNGIENTNLQSIISTMNSSISSAVNTEKLRAQGVEGNISQSLQTHTSNSTVHITSQERTDWNNETTYREQNELNISKAINQLNDIKANKEDINDLKETINNSLKESEQIISNAINELNRTKASIQDLDNLSETIYLLKQRIINLES